MCTQRLYHHMLDFIPYKLRGMTLMRIQTSRKMILIQSENGLVIITHLLILDYGKLKRSARNLSDQNYQLI